MCNVKLLDCTLRDGGYINDWKFGHDNMVSIFERLVDAGTDIIEIGFLDERRPFDMDRSIMPDTESVEKIYGKLDRKHAMVVGMIDYGTCSIEHVQPASESFLDGIRVIFKKHLREEALRFCGELKALGYKVFAQLVSVTSYNDEEMLDLVRLANEIKPFAVSIVDTYGLLHQDNLVHYFDLLNGNLDPEIGLGYHAHNNFQMAYANCIAVLEKAISGEAKRDMVVDGTIYGMGKSAGNAPLELLAMYMNQRMGTDYRIAQILEAIDANVMQFFTSPTWGYNMFYFLAASNDCHPSYVSYLTDKQTLSVKSIYDILGKLEGEKKLLFDQKYIEALYYDYQKNEVNDEKDMAALRAQLKGKKLLIVGPGKTVHSQSEIIKDFITKEAPTVISINRIPCNVTPDYIFLSNAKRYVQLATRLSQEKHTIIATSNVTATTENAFSFVLNYSTLIDTKTEIIDNSLAMLLRVLNAFGVREVTLAGFDGYSPRRTNYYESELEYDFVRKKAEYLNTYMTDFLKEIGKTMRVQFLTETRYTPTLQPV